MKLIKRLLTIIVGLCVLVLGIILMPLPGPGLPIVIGGLAILAIELPFCQKIIDRLQAMQIKYIGPISQRKLVVTIIVVAAVYATILWLILK